MIEEILTDLLARAPHIALSTSEDFDVYWEQVGFWLNQLAIASAEADGAEFVNVCDRWKIKFIWALHQAWGTPELRLAKCLQWAISDAMRDTDA